MKIIKKETAENCDLNFEETLASAIRNRERIRNLSNTILSSCSIFLSISFVIFFFIVKEVEWNKLVVLFIFLLSDLFIILAIFFCIIAVYINPPKEGITKFDLLTYESFYLVKEQRNIRVSIVLLFIGILLFLIGLTTFAFVI
jgi:hypothetical protein